MGNCRHKLYFSGRTKGSIRFGYDGLLYARRPRTGKWFAAEDIGIWLPIVDPHELEAAYQVWLRTCSNAELQASGVGSRKI